MEVWVSVSSSESLESDSDSEEHESESVEGFRFLSAGGCGGERFDLLLARGWVSLAGERLALSSLRTWERGWWCWEGEVLIGVRVSSVGGLIVCLI